MTEFEFEQIYMEHLNEQQKQAVRTKDGATLLLAVPGSGKTTVIVTRLGRLIYVEGIDPSKLLTITYTNAATEDMRERFNTLFAGEEQKGTPEFRTINSLCHGIIGEYVRSQNRTPFELTQDKDINMLLREILKGQGNRFPTDSDVTDLRTRISYIKNMRLSDEEIAEEMKDADCDVLTCYHQYCDRMRAAHRMDFDDQMVYARVALMQYPEILASYRRRYPYICVDEAQDTSKIQHEIIALLAGPDGNILMVGDEDQSIYGFRAAYPQALLNFTRTWPRARTLLIETNYRSNASIVQAADRFIAKNKARTPKHMVADRTDHEPIHVVMLNSPREQYRRLMEIAANIDPFETTAILYRNNESALPIVNLFEKEGMPYDLRQFDPTFFSNRIVTDICDTIRMAYDLYDPELFRNLYYKFGLRIKREYAIHAVNHVQPGKRNFWDLIMEDAKGKHLERLEAFYNNLQKIPYDNGEAAVRRIIDQMGYGEYLFERGWDDHKADMLALIGMTEPSPASLLSRLDELRLMIQTGQGSRKANDGQNSAAFELYEDDAQFAPEETGLFLSTIHSSKGLEYDHVILVDALPNVLPQIAERDISDDRERAQYEEERRLFYVAVTRARNDLTVFSYKTGTSPFVQELFGDKASARLEFAGHEKTDPSAVLQDGSEDFTEGARVRHRKFGAGTVVDRDGDLITVNFDEDEVKTLAASVVASKGILELLR